MGHPVLLLPVNNLFTVLLPTYCCGISHDVSSNDIQKEVNFEF